MKLGAAGSEQSGNSVSAVLRLARERGGPPHGWLKQPGPEPAVEFHGWLELMAAIEQLRSAPPKDT